MIRRFALSLLALSSLAAQAAPPPGHPSTEQAARILGVPEQGAQPYQGTVLQAIDSNNYTYIEVEQAGGRHLWLAAPKLTLRPGTEIGFGDGALMNRFYSKKLKRTFDAILFVGGVQPLTR